MTNTNHVYFYNCCIQVLLVSRFTLKLVPWLSKVWKCVSNINLAQESPPVWMQEAYRLPCSEYSFCCPILADPPDWPTQPNPPGWLTPPADWSPPGWGSWSPPQLSWLTDPPPPDVNRLKTVPSPILRMRAVKMSSVLFSCFETAE